MYYFHLVRSVEAYDVNIYRMHAAFMKDAVFTHLFSGLVSIVANYKLPFNVLMPRSPLFYYNNIVVDGCIFLFLSFQNVASKVCESYVCLTRNSTCDYYASQIEITAKHYDNSNIYHLEKFRLVFQSPNLLEIIG